MILSDFLSRQKHDYSNLHEIIPISFNMQSILHDKYYNIGNLGKYMVQTQSQVKSPFQEDVISEMYQCPDRSYFQEPQDLESLINTGRLV